MQFRAFRDLKGWTLDAAVEAMTSLLEPIMILVMGLLVAFIVFSILLPIFEMNQLVR